MGFMSGDHGMIRTTPAVFGRPDATRLAATARPLLNHCLAAMARHAQALAILDGIPLAALAHRRDVICVGFSTSSTHPPAMLALPRITGQHSLPPQPVTPRAIATGCRVGPRAFVSLWA